MPRIIEELKRARIRGFSARKIKEFKHQCPKCFWWIAEHNISTVCNTCRKEEKVKIIVHVSGGVVQDVLCNTNNYEVCILDADNLSEEEELEQQQDEFIGDEVWNQLA